MLEQIKYRDVICDTETDGIHATKIWCIVCKDINTDEVFKFRPRTPKGGHEEFKKEFLEFAKTVKCWIGHNFIGYDRRVILDILGLDIPVLEIVDTLILSRLFRPVTPFKDDMFKLKTDNRLGGHSLEAWGIRLGLHKISFNDFERFTEEMLSYCVRDVHLTHKIYLALMIEKEGFSEKSIKLEHQVAYLLSQQEVNGFYLDQVAAGRLRDETSALLDEMLPLLKQVFPPIPKLVRNHVPKYNKDGSLNKVSERIIETYSTNSNCSIEKRKNGSYDLFIKEEFNPNSPKQIAERLLALGWEPKKFTDKGHPKTDKETLTEAIAILVEQRPDKADLRYLANYSIITDRHQKVLKWFELVRDDARVHGRINPIGAGTHRCSHFDDNMANIARVVTGKTILKEEECVLYENKKKFELFDNNKHFLHLKGNELEYAISGLDGAFGWDCRSCWSVPTKDHCLVGADASGIQLRALAHYMNDKEYIKNLLEGDIHVVHQKAAGIATRNKAKTFIYAWLLGAGDEKIGSTVGVAEEEFEELFKYAENREIYKSNLLDVVIAGLRRNKRRADKRTVATIIKGFRTKENFLERTPALKRLKKKDIPEATKRGYLVGLDGRKLWIPNEHLAMSLYLQGFEAVIMKAAMVFYTEELNDKNIPFKQVAFVHDEFQIETYWEYADEVGKAVVNGIKRAGEVFKSNCPLDGEYKIGTNWATTH